MKWLELALIVGKLLAFVSTSQGGDWSGIRAYVKHPQEAWSGSSDCAPCNRFCSDLRKYNTEARALGAEGWRVGYNEVRSDGRDNAIVIMRAMDGEAVPYFVRVVADIETDRIEGYNGDIRAILKLWPGKTTTVRGELPVEQRIEIQRTFVDDSTVQYYRVRGIQHPWGPPLPTTPTDALRLQSQAHWRAPIDMRLHLATSHGYPISYLNTLSPAELQNLHDYDHNTGRVTPRGVQRWPIRSAPVALPSVQRSYAASGIQLGGFRVGTYGTRSYSSNCPSGRCPP